MMKLVLTRLLPLVASVAIFGSAFSPIGPTLNMFQAAADALAGETEVEVDVAGLTPAERSRAPVARKPVAKAERRKKLEAIAARAGKNDEDAFGWNAGDRAARPIGPPPSSLKKEEATSAGDGAVKRGPVGSPFSDD